MRPRSPGAAATLKTDCKLRILSCPNQPGPVQSSPVRDPVDCSPCPCPEFDTSISTTLPPAIIPSSQDTNRCDEPSAAPNLRIGPNVRHTSTRPSARPARRRLSIPEHASCPRSFPPSRPTISAHRRIFDNVAAVFSFAPRRPSPVARQFQAPPYDIGHSHRLGTRRSTNFCSYETLRRALPQQWPAWERCYKPDLVLTLSWSTSPDCVPLPSEPTTDPGTLTSYPRGGKTHAQVFRTNPPAGYRSRCAYA